MRLTMLISFFAALLVESCNPYVGLPEKLYRIDEFTHPGILLTMDDLAAIKQHVSSNDEPWATAYSQFNATSRAQITWTIETFENVHRDAYGANKLGDPAIIENAEAAYANALQWIITGEKAHAEKSIEILNAWADALKSITGQDAGLLAGMSAQKYCNAAEIILHTTEDIWSDDEVSRFETMLMTVFYPLIGNFLSHSPFSNGNWGLSMANAVVAIAVFCDDKEMFYEAIAHVANVKGLPYSTLAGYIDANTGQAQESGRDQAHTQMGLGYLVDICEVAWNQGIDLYGYLDNRLMKGIEYTVKYNLGYDDVPFYKMYGRGGDTISDESRGSFSPIYEKCYDHYVIEKGYSMPYTKELLETTDHRPEGFSFSMTSWSTLTRNPASP